MQSKTPLGYLRHGESMSICFSLVIPSLLYFASLTWFGNCFLTICSNFFNRFLLAFSKAPSALPIISVWPHNDIIHFFYACPVKQNSLALCQDSLFKLYTQYKLRSEQFPSCCPRGMGQWRMFILPAPRFYFSWHLLTKMQCQCYQCS